jgi:pyruvate dehydrogenase E1 component beta subunit
MTYSEAIREGMSIRMRENPNVVLFGEDVGAFGGCFGVSAGMFQEFGPERVRDTPISEEAIAGCAVGAAATGLRPIAELMFIDFVTVAMDQIVNQAAKMRYMFGGKIAMPMVVRMPAGAGTGAAAQHSQSLEAWLTHVPGLKVVYPSCAEDALGLMLTAIDDENPVMFIESKLLYGVKGEVTSKEPIPMGKGKVVKEGKDLSIITYGRQVYTALDAAKKLAADGIDAEVIDLRSLYPLDKELIGKTVEKTHKAIVITEEVKRGGYGGEISAMIAENFFDYLDAPVARIGALDTPVPFAPNLEQYYMPDVVDIIYAAKKMF